MDSTEGIEIPDEIVVPEQEQEDPTTPIQNFIQKKGKQTKYVYRSGLLDFFDFVMGKRMRDRGATADELKVYEKVAVKYLNQKRKHSADIVRYAAHLKSTKVNPKTSHVRIVAVKEFFLKHDIMIEEKVRKEIRSSKPKVKVSTNFSYIDRKILGEILHHGDARFKAFVLVLSSSGARLGEVLALNWIDIGTPDRIAYPDKPTSVFIRDSKTGDSRTTFISRECEKALSEWRKTYDSYREFATKRSKNLKSAAKEKQNGDNRVFPFTETSCYRMWEHALAAAGHFEKDEETGRTRMNIHRLRNFFSVQVASAVGTQVSEKLLGHADAYQGAYTGRSAEQLEQEYRKAEPALTTGAISVVIEQHAAELSSLKKVNQELTERLQQIEQTQAILEDTKTRAHGDPMYLELTARLERMEAEFKKDKQ